MEITWYGTASVLLETKEAALLFDPYMKDLPEGREAEAARQARWEAFRGQKNVLITHGHLDHLSSITALYADIPCTVYLTETPRNTLLAQGFPEEKLRLIRPGDGLKFGDITVHIIQGKHIQYDMKTAVQLFSRVRSWKMFRRMIRMARINRVYKENEETMFFEIIAEEKRVQLMGSAELAEGIAYPTGADVLILPHQGRSDMDRHNRVVVEKLEPRRILMDHYDDAFPPVSTEVPTEDFCREMSRQVPTEKLVEGISVEI